MRTKKRELYAQNVEVLVMVYIANVSQKEKRPANLKSKINGDRSFNKYCFVKIQVIQVLFYKISCK